MSESRPIACDLTALDDHEREHRSALAKKVHAAVVGRRELPNGYALKLDRQKVSQPDIEAWTALEGKCCPFLNFAILPIDGVLWLHLTGGPGVKEFLKAEMGLS
jgi:hypothetical protein